MKTDFNKEIKRIEREAKTIGIAIAAGVADYLQIKEMYAAKQTRTEKFYAVFRRFYQLRGIFNRQGLVKLISDGRETDIGTAIRKIADKDTPNSHLSFASKALHTINNDLPIYDSCVHSFFEFSARTPQGSFERNIARDESFYAALQEIYAKRRQNGLSNLVSVFDKCFPDTGISDVKKIDFMIWGFVRSNH